MDQQLVTMPDELPQIGDIVQFKMVTYLGLSVIVTAKVIFIVKFVECEKEQLKVSYKVGLEGLTDFEYHPQDDEYLTDMCTDRQKNKIIGKPIIVRRSK